jgi:subtilisin family serine protease
MTLRTMSLIDRYNESQQQASPHARTATKSAPTSDEGDNTVGVVLSVSSTFDVKALDALGVAVGTCVSDVVTLRATPAQLAQVAGLTGVLFMSADSRVRKKLDVAVPLVKADAVQQGTDGLPQAYTGEGVVVGIVDWGFDLTHPTFYDTAGNLRIARVWDQTDSRHKDSNPYYKYGSIYAEQADIEQKRCTSSDESHGTHVAGIAAGGGGATSYRGVAPGAELVLVQLRDGSNAELIDGIGYIFTYASQAGKPAVVNLSLGSHYGPHDGTSDFDRALDGLVGAGRVAVGAAGNEGMDNLHASYTFSQSSNTVRTVLGVMLGKSAVEAYADIGQQLSWTVELWDAEKNTRLQQANGNNFYSTQSGASIKNKSFIANATDTVIVSATGYNSDGHNRRGIVEVEVKNSRPGKYAVVLVLKADAGTVHLWNLGNTDENMAATFSVLKNSSYAWVDGNTSYTIGEVGGTAKGIICVGAYNSKGNTSTVGEIAGYSSKGPTADGRVKPDVIAPGSYLTSSMNSCAGRPFPSTYEVKNGRRYYYSTMEGTSMATPMVTGSVALLLQQHPTLTPDNVRCMIQQNAYVDASIENLSQNTRGAGKLDVLSAAKNGIVATCKSLSVPRLLWGEGRQTLDFRVAPNPNSGTFWVEADEAEANLTLSVYSLMGALLYSSPVQAGGEVELSFLPSGVYVVQLSNGKKVGAKKMMVYR